MRASRGVKSLWPGPFRNWKNPDVVVDVVNERAKMDYDEQSDWDHHEEQY